MRFHEDVGQNISRHPTRKGKKKKDSVFEQKVRANERVMECRLTRHQPDNKTNLIILLTTAHFSKIIRSVQKLLKLFSTYLKHGCN